MAQPKTSLIITTIGSFDQALHEYGILCAQNNVDFIIIGDKKTKPDLSDKFTREKNEYKLAGEYYPIDKQEQLQLTILKYLPYNHYARKNIGYLLAMNNHAEVILETDDDNYPQDNFRFDYCKEVQGCLVSHSGWVNVYRYFSDQLIWPRGFPLGERRDGAAAQVLPIDRRRNGRVGAPQGAVAGGPPFPGAAGRDRSRGRCRCLSWSRRSANGEAT